MEGKRKATYSQAPGKGDGNKAESGWSLRKKEKIIMRNTKWWGRRNENLVGGNVREGKGIHSLT